MQASAPAQAPVPPSGTNFPSSNPEASHAGAASCTALLRVGRFLQALSAARQITDAEIRQHAADCSLLMEQAYDRFQACGNPADREEAVLWMHRRDEAHRSLSPAWKAAREAQIQQQIAEGAGYFMDEGDAARARIALAGRRA